MTSRALKLFVPLISLLLANATLSYPAFADFPDDEDVFPPPLEQSSKQQQQQQASEDVQSVLNETQTKTPLLKGGITFCVPKGTPIKLKLASVPDYGMKMLSRDLDGNLVPAKLGEVITAKTTEDIYIDDNKVIPQGTVFYGAVTKIIPPKRVGRPGSLILGFKEFKTPDGRVFRFEVNASSAKASTMKSKAKGTGIVLAHAAGGAIVGALIAYELFGLEKTISMHGYNIAGGAAAGALMGTAVGLMRHGPVAVLEPGDDLTMEIDTDMLIPAATAPTAKLPSTNLPGLEIKVNKTKVIKDGLDGYQLKFDGVITNNTNRRLNSIDLFVEDDNGVRFPVVADAEEDKTDMIFNIDPYTESHIKCDFQYEFPKLKRKLVWVDHGSRGVLFEQKLP